MALTRFAHGMLICASKIGGRKAARKEPQEAPGRKQAGSEEGNGERLKFEATVQLYIAIASDGEVGSF